MAKNAMIVRDREIPVIVRHQLDNHDEFTRACALVCLPDDDRTRQEFRDEANINNIVARFYPFAPPQARIPQFGEQDMSLDLHSAVLSIQAAREAYAEVPAKLREAFPTYSEFVSAVADGRLTITSEDSAEVPSAGSAEVPSEAPAGKDA